MISSIDARVAIALFCAACAVAYADQISPAATPDAPQGANIPDAVPACTVEHGVTVCRHDISGAESAAADPETQRVVRTENLPSAPGRLVLLLDIPSDVFARLADDPAENLKYRPSSNWDYRRPPQPPQKSMITRSSHAWEPANPVWRYQPPRSFEYQPTRSWSYDPDVVGRLWRANIVHDTRVVVRPIPQPGVYLLPVQRIE